jgi:hypothetical protein
MTGHILIFPGQTNNRTVFDTLAEAFGDRLLYFRDITRSTRSLFRNRRDDIDVSMYKMTKDLQALLFKRHVAAYLAKNLKCIADWIGT